MGLIDEALAAIDRAKRIGKRNVADLMSDPYGQVQMAADRADNFNRGVAPVAAGGELSRRPLTDEELTRQYLNAVFPPGMGMGAGIASRSAANVAKPMIPMSHASTVGSLRSLGAIDDAAYGRLMGAPTMSNELLNLLHSEAVNLHGLRRGMLSPR